jgi:hypothetical protein
MNSKRNAILDRIKRLEDAIAKGREYLENGSHAHWHGFRPLFAGKVKNGKPEPPHKDWVKNVFLPRREKALRKAENTLEKLMSREGDTTAES